MNKQKKLSLALGAGSSKGLVHLGVIQYLIENNIPIGAISGSSAGSIFGGTYVAFNDIYKAIDMWNKMGKKNLAHIFTHLSPKKLRELFIEALGSVKIEDLSTPFRAVATEPASGKKYVFTKGLLVDAMIASASIPVMTQPFLYDGMYLTDGGSCEQVPVQTLLDEFDYPVLAIDINDSLVSDEYIKGNKVKNPIKVSQRSIELFEYYLSKENAKHADLVLTPNVTESLTSGVLHSEKLVQIGYDLAKEKGKKIKDLLAA